MVHRRGRLVAGLVGLGLALAARTVAGAQTSPPTASGGGIPQRIRVTVTGNPASPAFLASRIDEALAAALRPTLPAGATVRTGDPLPGLQPLERGFLTTYDVPVTIDGEPGTAPVSATTTVDVVNAALPALDPRALSFLDDPERITADGVLSRTTVAAGAPIRLYYYHENMVQRRRFCVVLSANDSVRTRLQIVAAAGGPNVDVMSVGHAVTKTFISRQPAGEGVVLEIAGGEPVLERDVAVGPGEGIVGAADLRVLDGGPVTVTIMAIPPAGDPADYLYAPKLPDDGHDRHGSFDLSAFGQRVIAYTAGGRDVSYRYATRAQTPPNVDPADAGRDYGDYGVLQRVTFDLVNPAAATTTVYLYEKPLGGVVRSSFIVNGNPAEVGCVRVPQRYLIASLALAPRAAQNLDVLTMTDGGSNYPLEIGVSANPPLPAAPPINAADGCFPKPGGPPAATQPASGPAGP